MARLFTVPLEPARAFIKLLMDTVFHIEVSGADSVPKDGGGILICNHTDLIDVPIQAVYTPRKVVFLGKAELFEQGDEMKKFLFREGSPLNLPGISAFRPVIEKGLETYGAVIKLQMLEWGGRPIIRNFKGDGAREAVEYYQELENYIVQLLKEGHVLSIFPEGTRTSTGVMGPFKAMAAKLAIRAGVPLIPSGISGSFQFLTPQSIFSGRMFKNIIQYNFGSPIYPDEFPKLDEKRAAKELTAILEKQVYALSLHGERRSTGRGRSRVL
ncbi:MAG: 1-acyl-sn-glycerol-3-phosphate acyltransferase [Spirochaetia bacterium]|nr:1-acyl-sn-glycerol-3-phosphate acyltransferase [Spirochaetia bacterium]